MPRRSSRTRRGWWWASPTSSPRAGSRATSPACWTPRRRSTTWWSSCAWRWREAVGPSPRAADPATSRPSRRPPTRGTAISRPTTAASRPPTGINPKYTFDVFVIGASNRFAHAAALAVAESPAQSYNPLFIHGSTGLGKTHLLQAIGHYVLQQHPQLNVRYVTTETVLNEFVDSMRDGRMVTLQAALPHLRRAAGRRHPVHRGQGAPAGGVFPHVQQPVRGRKADRAVLGPAAA